MKFTAQILAFYMFIGSFIPMSDFSQLIHLPDVVEHYQLHVEEAQKSGVKFVFLDFLKIHSFNADGHQHSGNDDHDNCPFQFFHSSNSFVLTTADFSFSGLKALSILENLSYKNAFYLNGFVSTETQPPCFI